MTRPLPLAGVRVLDLTQVWAGSKCTLMLAGLGAQIIKVESPSRPDPVRGGAGWTNPNAYPGRDPGSRPYNRAANFNTLNRGKLGITLDLRSAPGLALFKRLVAVCDVVAENFSATVMARLGLGPAELHAIKPAIITLSMPGFGASGPERDYIAWAPTIEAAAGLSQLIGYEGGPPMPSFQSFPDPFSGIFGVAAVLTALRHARQTGRGQHIELSQQEALIPFGAAALLDHQMNGRITGPRGNTDPDAAPSGIYRCSGDEEAWLAISVRNGRDWGALVDALGRPAWALEPRYLSALGRVDARREIDDALASWCAHQDAETAMGLLQRSGVPCGRVLSTADLSVNAQLRARGILETVDHPEAGPHLNHRILSFRFASGPWPGATAAPVFGQHTAAVLGGILGLSAEEIDTLHQQGVIADSPNYSPR